MKILFITANRLGDAVLSTGVLAALIEQNPSAEITIACGPYAAGLFRAVPGLKHIHVLEKQTWNRHWFALWRQCVTTRWDIIVDMRNSVVSRLLWSQRTLRRGQNTRAHKVIENAWVLDLLLPPSPTIWVDTAAESEARKIIGERKSILALAPAANWPCKQWPIERFSVLANQLTAADGVMPDAAIMIVADERERAEIKPLLESISDAKRIEVIGHDLQTVAACLKGAALFVGNDSGLMHLSAAVGTRTLGLFGPGYEDIYGPWGPNSAFVRTVESREELLGRLPNLRAREPNLMTGLSVAMVIDAVKEMVAR
jgi:lipopolysaccharide export system permease protein